MRRCVERTRQSRCPSSLHSQPERARSLPAANAEHASCPPIGLIRFTVCTVPAHVEAELTAWRGQLRQPARVLFQYPHSRGCAACVAWFGAATDGHATIRPNGKARNDDAKRMRTRHTCGIACGTDPIGAARKTASHVETCGGFSRSEGTERRLGPNQRKLLRALGHVRAGHCDAVRAAG